MAENNKYQKLELTWIGKGEEPKLEPRILIENPEYSYGDPFSENMLIHGDNLLALKALEQDYAGKVKCIYIDPPYNTGNAFEHYDDNLEHSIWLNLIKPRLDFLKTLLSKDGLIFIQIDDTEVSYLQVLCDEIFGRSNRVNTISVKMSETSGVKMAHVEKKLPKLKEYILVYKKSADTILNPIRIPKSDEDGYLDQYLKYYSKIIENPEETARNWRIIPIREYLEKNGYPSDEESLKKFKLENANRVVYRTNNKSFKGVSFATQTEEFISATGIKYIWWEGKQMLFLSDYVEEYLGDLWLDISTINLNKEGGVDFPNGKKPEKLIERIINLSTNKNDIILDSFLGSGSTSAVAHKMGRRWIGVELGEHAKTHCYQRLKGVVDGEQGGISKSVDWKGGGGFKFYTLAPSLLNTDQYGNWVISKEYNANMLAAAMAKQEGFRYQPDETVYWKQGKSSEKDYIFTTTQFVTVEALDKIHDEMHPDESLLIACKAFQLECENRHSNISIKKIPGMLLGKCEFGKDDYSLNIVNVPTEELENPAETDTVFELPVIPDVPKPERKKKPKDDMPTLF
jgi:adenine-specific DNA-methyltransferase